MSFGAAVLTFREGLEAALIVAIMLGYLRKVGRLNLRFSIWAGALSAGLLAVGFTLVLQLVGAQFDYPAKGIYEGVTSLIAVVMLTYMIFWMARMARFIKGSLEHSMKESLVQSAGWGMFGLAFMTVAREGVETALFLSASAFQTSGTATLFGGIAGLLVALGVAWAVYVAGVRLQMRTFFKFTSILLVIFAAAILRYAVHEFEEVGWLPPLVEHVWNTGGFIATGSPLGSVLQALIGYTSQPSLMQLIFYFGYLLVVGYFLLRPAKSATPAPSPAVTTPVVNPVAERQGEPVTTAR
ncbi:MAG TPA: FTR1 family protein [Chloroflexia bacterium]|nr:FTR1 family protein [Chloroflexia bacterium]